MRIIKKFNQYIKEDVQPQLNPVGRSYEEDFEDEDLDLGDEDIDLEADEHELSNKFNRGERDDDTMNFDDKETYDQEDEFDDEPHEEEEGEYKGGRMMKELASKLGAQIVENEIQYGGHTVTCPSEDDIFRIGKRKFRGVEDIYNFLKSGSKGGSEVPVTEKKKIACNCCEKCSGTGKCRCKCKNCKCK